jgi:hypothetical protein
VPDERLTDDEVALVLRRASELDVGGTRSPDGLPVTAVEAAASEVGLSPAAVRQAVAELRTGALHDDGRAIVCARVVPGTCAAAIESVGRWLQGQAMVRARDRGTEQVWRPREDMLAGLQRRFDFAAAIRLKPVEEVVVRGVEVEGGTLVRLTATLQRQVDHAPAIGAGIGAAAGTSAALLGLADPLLVLSAVPGAALVGTAGWRVGRSSRAKQRRKVADAIDGLLDELELGRGPTATPFEKLASRARRLRTGYRL